MEFSDNNSARVFNVKGIFTMRKAVLYIAMSIDGYIADGNGGVGWLNGQDATVQTEDT